MKGGKINATQNYTKDNCYCCGFNYSSNRNN